MNVDISSMTIYIVAKTIYTNTLDADTPAMGGDSKAKTNYIQTIDADIETIDIYI